MSKGAGAGGRGLAAAEVTLRQPQEDREGGFPRAPPPPHLIRGALKLSAGSCV